MRFVLLALVILTIFMNGRPVESEGQEQGKVDKEQDDSESKTVHQAASDGDLGALQKVADENDGKVQLTLKDENGWTPLHEATRMGQLDAAKFLVENGANVNERTNQGVTPLFLTLAFHGEDHPVVEYLRSLGAESNGPANEQLGFHQVEEEHWGSTEAHRAAIENNVDRLWEISRTDKELLHKKDSNGWAPIHEASRMGHLEVVELLVWHGANVNERTRFGATPLFIALQFVGEDHQLVSYLRSLNAESIAPVEEEEVWTTRAHEAASSGDVEALKEIAQMDKDMLLQKDSNGWVPLHESARVGHVEASKLLIEHGANVNEPTRDGSTPLRVAKEFVGEDHPVVAYLKELGGIDGGPEL